MARLIARGQYRKTVEIQKQLNPTNAKTDQHWIVSLIANELWREGKVHSSWQVTSRWPPIWQHQCDVFKLYSLLYGKKYPASPGTRIGRKLK